jgi:hypothetical protein
MSNIESVSDASLDECEVCNQCETVLLPDDECYLEFGTNDPLCTECCFYDEYLSSYIRGTIEASHTRLRIELDVA